MKITIAINTAQVDYPYTAFPNTHLFELTMRSLREQTFRDFEVVVADVNYDERKDYFKENPEDFPINHVKIKPNVWIPFNHFAISTTKNTCLLHAKGGIVASIGSCVRFDKHFVEKVVEGVEDGNCIISRFSIERGDEIVFKDLRPDDAVSVHGNVAASMEDWLLINGYDEMYDGSKGIEDCDVGERLLRAEKEIKMIDGGVVYEDHITCYPLLTKSPRFQKCQFLWWTISADRKQIAANKNSLTDLEYDYLQSCKYGDTRRFCLRNLRCMYCSEDFECFFGKSAHLTKLYMHPSLIFDLKEQQKNPRLAVKRLAKLCEIDNLKKFVGEV